VTPFLLNTERVRALLHWFRPGRTPGGTGDTGGDASAWTLDSLVRSNGTLHGMTRGSSSTTHGTTEFTLYEVFTCCHPQRRGEPDPWRGLSVEEVGSYPHTNFLRFLGRTSERTLEELRGRTRDSEKWDAAFLVGWHKDIPRNGTSFHTRRGVEVANGTFFAEFVRGMGALLKKGGVLRDESEVCDFYTSCASGVVPCA